MPASRPPPNGGLEMPFEAVKRASLVWYTRFA
jgi:hypothetical protein